MKLGAFKNFSLFKPRTKYPCKHCGCTYPVYGDTWLEVMKPVKAVDGKKAFRIFWLCHSGHRHFRGYSKPVDWAKNLSGNMTENDGKTYEEEEEEIENEYKELVEFANMKSGDGTCKRYY